MNKVFLLHILDYMQGVAAVAMAWLTIPKLTAAMGLLYISLKTYSQLRSIITKKKDEKAED